MLAESRLKSETLQHNFRSERVHLVPLLGGNPNLRLKCHRCSRELPEDQFFPVHRIERGLNLRKGFQALHPYCFTCRKQIRGQWIKHPGYTPALDRYWQKYMPGIRTNAKKRGLLVSVTKDDLLGMYLEQGGVCAISGIKLDWKSKWSATVTNKARRAPSVDRINSGGNYVLGNVQIVAHIVNTMKSDLPQESFIEMCRLISARSISVI